MGNLRGSAEQIARGLYILKNKKHRDINPLAVEVIADDRWRYNEVWDTLTITRRSFRDVRSTTFHLARQERNMWCTFDGRRGMFDGLEPSTAQQCHRA